MVGALFSSDAWNNVTFTAAEVRDPRAHAAARAAARHRAGDRALPATNFAYLSVLPATGAPDGASALARGIAYATEIGSRPPRCEVMLEQRARRSWRCDHDLDLRLRERSGARGRARLHAMAHDGVPRHAAARPRACLLGARAAGRGRPLALSGRYGQLLDYVIAPPSCSTRSPSPGLSGSARRSHARRRARVTSRRGGGDARPAGRQAGIHWPGLVIVASGLPVYFLWRRARA